MTQTIRQPKEKDVGWMPAVGTESSTRLYSLAAIPDELNLTDNPTPTTRLLQGKTKSKPMRNKHVSKDYVTFPQFYLWS